MSEPRAILAAGNVYIDPLDANGNPTGMQLEGSTANFKVSPENELKELPSKGRDNFGEIIASVMVPGKTKLSFTLQTPTTKTYAMAVLGTAAPGTQAAGTVTDASVTTIADRYVDLAKKKLSGIVVKNEAGDVTYDLDSDYKVDLLSGMIKALASGAIAAGAVVKVTYDHAAFSFATITPNSNPSARFKIFFAGKNFADNKLIEMTGKKVGLALTGELDYSGDDFLKLELSGTCEIPTGETHAVEMMIEE